MIDLLSVFIVFFSVIDPIGTVPVFIAVTNGRTESERRAIAVRATLIAAAILMVFVVLGEMVLTALDIPLAAFQISGGIILFLFALTMIFGDSKPEEELKLVSSANETAVFPLAVPSIAGPGAMLAAVMQTENALYSVVEQLQVASMIVAVLLVVLVLMLASNFIIRLIGESGASVISRIMGFILAAVAATSILEGFTEYFSL